MLVYGKTWLETKWDSKLESGPLHLLNEVIRQRTHFDGEALEIVQRYTQINGFFAHGEQTLLHLVCSTMLEEREVGVRHILRIRREKLSETAPGKKKRRSKIVKTVRKYKPQEINWRADSVENLVDLTNAESEPPLTMNISDREVEGLVVKPLEIREYECISQFVERAVKSTTEAAAVVTGGDRQDALTLNKNVARKKTPNIQHKKYYKV